MDWLIENQGVVLGVLGLVVGWLAKGRKDLGAVLRVARAIVDAERKAHPDLDWLKLADKALTEFERVTGLAVTDAVVTAVEKRAKR